MSAYSLYCDDLQGFEQYVKDEWGVEGKGKVENTEDELFCSIGELSVWLDSEDKWTAVFQSYYIFADNVVTAKKRLIDKILYASTAEKRYLWLARSAELTSEIIVCACTEEEAAEFITDSFSIKKNSLHLKNIGAANSSVHEGIVSDIESDYGYKLPKSEQDIKTLEHLCTAIWIAVYNLQTCLEITQIKIPESYFKRLRDLKQAYYQLINEVEKGN